MGLESVGHAFTFGAYRPQRWTDQEDANVDAAAGQNELDDLIRNQDARRAQEGAVQEAEKNTLAAIQAKGQEQAEIQSQKMQKRMEESQELFQQAQDMQNDAYNAQKKMIEQTAEIRKLLDAVSDKSASSTQVERSIQALEICVQTMGKLKVTFQRYRIFWAGMTNQTQKIADMSGDFKFEKKQLERTREIIYQSAQTWAAI